MATIVRVDGWPCAPATAEAFTSRLKPAFERAFPGVTLHVYSGYRSYDDQVRIFTDRYRRGAYSPYGDYRWWDGSRWGRVSGEWTVAAPGTSNHQSGHALDIRDSGSDAGVTVAGNARSNWIRQNASAHGFTPIGYTFAEPWHVEYAGDPWAGGTGGGGGSADYDYDGLELDMSAQQDIEWIKERLGGSISGGGSVTKEIRQLQADVAWLKDRIGGTSKTDSVTDFLRDIKG